jgi:probable addiction module antidote protein
MNPVNNHHAYVVGLLQDPVQAKQYLEIALENFEEDGNSPAFLMALRTLVEANGGIGILATKTGLSRQNLYRVLSHNGNPAFKTVSTILQTFGYRLSVQPVAIS